LLKDNDRVLGMASYNRERLEGIDSLIVEGIAMLPEIQGYGLFARMTDAVKENEDLVCLRTQNPRMYRALEKYCHTVCPGGTNGLKAPLDSLAKYFGNDIDSNGVVKGYYGGLFYGDEPHHEKIDFLFEDLGVDLNNGDAVLAVGLI